MTKARARFPGIHGQCGGVEQGGSAFPHLIQRVLLCLSGCRAAYPPPSRPHGWLEAAPSLSIFST